MQVETYEVEEIKASDASTMAADAEAQELIEKLGLGGQKRLLNTETCTRFPYRYMTAAEHRVFSMLFSRHEKIEAYTEGPIPLRVLQVAAYCKESPAPDLKFIEVWHTGSAKEDPILVGRTQDYGGKFYLLARWGDALETFEKLAAKAQKLWMSKAKAKLEQKHKEAETDLASLEEISLECFTTGKCSSANFQYELESLA